MKKTLFTVLVMCIFSLLSSGLMAQGKTLTGRVLASDTGEPIPFASVFVKDHATLGGYTDDNGRFTIQNVPAAATHLNVSYMGYVAVEIPIGNQTNFIVKLDPDAISLDQVVVTALGIQRQSKEIGYATAKVSSDDLTKTKNMDAAQALMGKVSGLQISLGSASLDADVRVNLRGNRSFKGNNQALLIVDGVPTPLDYLQSMNPNDIENISVLKGGSSAALYGSSAANGVLYVTTKKGERGRPRVTYSLTTTFDKMAYFPKYQKRFGGGYEDGSGFGVYVKDENQQYGPEFDGSTVPIGQTIMLPNGEEKQLYGTYDFKDGAREGYYQTGVGLQNDISFASGGDNGSFFMSYQHAHRTGTITGDEIRRQTIRFNASRIYKKLKVGGNLSYSNTKSDLNWSGSNGMQALWNTPGNIDLPAYKDWKNVEGANPNDWNNSYYLNPYAQIELYRRESRNDRITASADLEYKPLKWLRFQGRAGLNVGIRNYNGKYNPWHYSQHARDTRSYASSDIYTYLRTNSNYSNRISVDAMMFAEHKFNDKFQIKGMVGWSLQDNYSEYKQVTAGQMAIDGFFNLSNKVGELAGENSYNQSRAIGVYGSIDFSMFGWAYLQLTGRNDWSSQLAPSNWSFFYPGANLSVMLSDALPVIKQNKWLSYLKLRGTYAKVGTVNIGNYNLYDIANKHSSFPFGTLTGYYLSQNIRNANIKPEFTTEFEVGAEVGFLKDRIVLEAAYYHQKTTDQTVNIGIPYSTGAATKYMNAGTMVGQGVELDLRLTPLFRIGDFSWNVNANATFSKTEVTELYGGLDEMIIDPDDYPLYAIVGQSYPVIKATDFKRDPQGRVVVNATTGLPVLGDMVDVGTTEPNVRIGLSTVMRWKGFSLSATFDYRGGHVTRFDQESEMLFTGASYTSAIMGRQRFVFPNSVIEVQNADGSVSYQENTNITVNSGSKDFWVSNFRSCAAYRVVSANVWKWRELSISYDLPERLLDKTRFFQRISVGFVGRNLFMWTPDTNLWGDPESWSGTGNANSPGIAGNAQAGSRTFGFNVTLSF